MIVASGFVHEFQQMVLTMRTILRCTKVPPVERCKDFVKQTKFNQLQTLDPAT